MKNRRERRKARKAERTKRGMATARYLRWLPDWSWKRVIVGGVIMVGLLLTLSLSVDNPTPDLHLRALLVAIGTVVVAALAYLKE